MSSTYLSSMFSRLIIMLATLAITVVTTVGSAHAIGMNSGPSHMMHADETMHSEDLACEAGQQCGSAAAEMCEYVCTGFSAFPTSPDEQAKHFHGSVHHDISSDVIHVSRAPALNKRPPKLRFV
ncbi:hypothetical protein EU803_04775 [Loktanella sp. IMCC34160]|uniref:hypothetical protein n=1 Tax=Loktanella sp. IMCC34160 TaxID=2510646 RepID=UPI00101DF7C7|nr:hypothetical protein [Loktanella sp. IMCC34160]RYG91776.1 hypothetical protein EU803_04775 [Loktanella sp. IMCC34160]